MGAARCKAAGLVGLAGQEQHKSSPAQHAGGLLGAGEKADVLLGVRCALGGGAVRPAPALAAGQIQLQVGVAAVNLKGSVPGGVQAALWGVGDIPTFEP